MANLNLTYGVGRPIEDCPTLPVKANIEGLHEDACPQCDTHVEPYFKNGALDGSGLGYHDFSIYSHSRRDGGCGLTWSRAGAQAVERMQARGVNPKWVEGAGMTQRSVSIPSQAYQDAWERIFGKKD